MPRLYELSNELCAILGHEDDEITDEIAEQLAKLELALELKVEAVLQYRQGILGDADAFEAEAKRLKARADAMTRKAEWLKGYVHSALVQVGIGKMSTGTFTATVAKSPLKVELEGEIPAEYKREKVSVEFDRTKALEDYKAGKPLPTGVTVKQSTHLRIS